MSHRRTRIAALAGLTFATVLASTATGVTAAQATPPNNGPASIIALGDGFISGEGGRRAGNIWLSGDSHTDDRNEYSVTRQGEVYGQTLNYLENVLFRGGCHRSDSAEINGVAVPIHLNLACSRAGTPALIGETFHGEDPQLGRLATHAQWSQVKAIVVTVGAGDLGYDRIMTACIDAYKNNRFCMETQEPDTAGRVAGGVETAVGDVLGRVKATMAAQGYSASDYQLIVQSYPTPIADITHTMPGDAWHLGCPFRLSDADWMVRRLMPRLEGLIQHAAQAQGARFLNLRDAFKGHELCAAGRSRSPVSGNPSDPNPQPAPIATAEWVNGFPTRKGIAWIQDDNVNRLNESFYPNWYGQQVLQKCLNLMLATTGDQACVNTLGAEGPSGTDGIALRPNATPTGPDIINENRWYQTGFCKASANGYTHLCFEPDGNLRIYAGSGWQEKWSTAVAYNPGNVLILQSDGQLVIYGPGGWLPDAPAHNVKWQSGNWGNPASYVQVGGRGVDIFNAAGYSTWSRGGFAEPPREGPPGS
ncbi:hypothetical protein J5X84_04365 [Streptosporangiaceae bacterium NEAU-GS5]|nr:hypothetical protein [Streptosporangiaceae bacterium NEAU-GS5]